MVAACKDHLNGGCSDPANPSELPELLSDVLPLPRRMSRAPTPPPPQNIIGIGGTDDDIETYAEDDLDGECQVLMDGEDIRGSSILSMGGADMELNIMSSLPGQPFGRPSVTLVEPPSTTAVMVTSGGGGSRQKEKAPSSSPFKLEDNASRASSLDGLLSVIAASSSSLTYGRGGSRGGNNSPLHKVRRPSSSFSGVAGRGLNSSGWRGGIASGLYAAAAPNAASSMVRMRSGSVDGALQDARGPDDSGSMKGRQAAGGDRKLSASGVPLRGGAGWAAQGASSPTSRFAAESYLGGWGE